MNRAVVLAALACASIHCAGAPLPRVELGEGERAYVSHDYERVLARWTREGGVLTIPEMEDRLRVAATCLSWDWQWAYWARYGSDAAIVETERARLRDTALSATRDEVVFYVALETERTRWGELGRPLSAWRVSLVDDAGREVLPTRIERYRRASSLDQTYFPYTSPWRQVFRLHFPRRIATTADARPMLDARTRWFLLRFGGPLGHADLRWDVAP